MVAYAYYSETECLEPRPIYIRWAWHRDAPLVQERLNTEYDNFCHLQKQHINREVERAEAGEDTKLRQDWITHYAETDAWNLK